MSFALNSQKLSQRTKTLTTIKNSDSNFPQNEDDFMSQYYPKILFIENNVGRIINRYKIKGKKFAQRQKNIKEQYQTHLKKIANDIESRF